MTTNKAVHISPIAYASLADTVYRSIKEKILNHEIPRGARIRDEELAGQLGVSRTPIREAIRTLIRDGLVEVVPRSMTRVRNFTEQDIIEIFDIRIELESFAARKSAGHIPQVQLQNLRSLHEAAEEGLRAGSPKAALEFDREMHRVILESCGNERLKQMMLNINDSVAFFRKLGERSPAHRGFNYRHREIMRALFRKDGDAAAKALSEHILMSKEQTLHDFDRRQFQGVDQSRAGRVSRRPKGAQ
ncbi:MAG: GntR family transcriptional regulator [Nitrososphaerales archaeon]